MKLDLSSLKDESIAAKVFEAIPDFLKETEYLCKHLEERDAKEN